MGRSVSFPTGAIVAFATFELADPEDSHFEFDWFVDDLRRRAHEAFPSLEEHDGWRDREDRILMRNAFADFGVSEYMGLVAIWIVEREDGASLDADWRTARSPRAQRWIQQIARRFDSEFGELDLLGRFSNGEAIFRRRNAGATAAVSA